MGEARTEQPATVKVLEFSRSARSDVRWWALLITGLVFAFAGYSIDPRTNCSDSGECAPWLVPVALAVGLLATLSGLAQLIVNPRRGSYVDVAAGELIWWEGKLADGRVGSQGRLALSNIARVRIVDGGDNADEIFLYDHDNQLLPFGGSEVIRWPYSTWAEQLAALCPRLVVEQQ